MSGSRRWFEYEADDGQTYAIQLDESKGEAVVQGLGVACNPLTQSRPRLPCGTKRRFINCTNLANPNSRARITIGRRAVYDAIGQGGVQVSDAGGDFTAAVTWTVGSKRGEKSNFPLVNVDTGLLDGDNP